MKLGPFEINTIIQGNCLEVMGKMPDGCIDMILTDPPWMVSQQITIHRSMDPKKYKYTGKDIDLDFGDWDHFESEEAYLTFTKEWVQEVARVTKEKGHLIIFFDQDRASQLIGIAKAADCQRRQHLYWLKTNPVPRARKVDFMSALEHAIWFTKGNRSKATFNYQLGQQRNYVAAPIPGHTTGEDGARVHPTQKPVKVLKTWIAYLTESDEIVFDPFMGSGATGIAAARVGRNFFGCDISEKFAKVAGERVMKFVQQPTLLQL